MSDNNQNQNNRPAAASNASEHTQKGGQGHRNNRHRSHHRGHRSHHHPRKEMNPNVQEPSVTEAPVNAAQESDEKVPKGHESSRPKEHAKNTAGERREKHDNNRENRNNRQRHGGRDRERGEFRHTPERRPYDPYETPSREEIELSKIRAQIVIQSADGSVPKVYGDPVAPRAAEPEQAQTPVAETAVEETAVLTADVPTEESDPTLTPAPEAPAPLTEDAPRVEVVGVRFRSAGKMYYFDPNGIQAQKGVFAIVETTRGPEFGEICLANTLVNASETVSPLRPLLRLATPADVAHNEENRAREKDALEICRKKIADHGLGMKLIDAQYAFDNSKLLFYFSAEGRVDFRELVKDLASAFRTRIELRQIGIRDEAKMLGGIGACGRALCCSTFLPDFAQVSIKMAKEQNLSLNASKISGLCGRLMCCLRYESEVYAEEIKKTPANDALVRTEDGVGVVISSNPLAGTIRVLLKDAPDTPPKQYHRDDVTVLPKEHRRTADRRDGESRADSSKNNS